MTREPASPVLTGEQVGVYHVLELIGAGAMGEVYRARDGRLGRDVAVKILPRGVTADPDRLTRFEREARVLASLNHPNIATIHGVEESQGIRALVMELVDGMTLSERLANGAMPVHDSLLVARQIADALEAAHEKGLIHRDLKPANVMITPAGVVKILDFGLAKAVGADSIGPDWTEPPTLTAGATRQGLIVGTAAYMSPEQARGKPVDERTDVWAFGCVLYEMLTGRTAFARETVSDTVVAVLDREPDWELLPAGVPADVSRLLRLCLAKEPRRRLRDIGDARLLIEEILGTPLTDSSPALSGISGQTSHSSARRWMWLTTGVASGALLAVGVMGWVVAKRPYLEPPAQFSLSFGGQMAGIATTSTPRPSPDGRHFVFVGFSERGGTSIWVRPLESAEARLIPGTDGGSAPFWSADGRWIGFYADGKLKKVSPTGGPAQTIAALSGVQDAAWGPHGDIIYRPSNRQPLFRISESGGQPAPLTHLNRDLAENSHRGPAFLADGRRFLFTSRCAAPENNALYIGSLDSSEVRQVMNIESKAAFVPSRDGAPAGLLYYRDGGLVWRAFDPDSDHLIGDPQPVITGVDYNAAGIAAFFEVSADGRVIVFRPTGGSDSQLTWFRRTGEQTGSLGEPGDLLQPRISPRGDRVALTRPDAQTGNRDIWTIEIARGITARVTRHPANDWHAVWTPDGVGMLFSSDRDGSSEGKLYIKQSVDSGGEEKSLTVTGPSTDWSRNGEWIAYGGANIEMAPASGTGTARQLLATPSIEGSARFSPDGRWIAYVSNETGRFEVFVHSLDPPESGTGRKIPISDAGGDFPVWRRDGRELFFMSGDFNIYSVTTSDLHLTGEIPPRPQKLFRSCPGSIPIGQPMRGQLWAHPFDTVDGQSFLVNCAAGRHDQFTVLMNWSPGDR